MDTLHFELSLSRRQSSVAPTYSHPFHPLHPKMDEERKRTYEPSEGVNNDEKRLRPGSSINRAFFSEIFPPLGAKPNSHRVKSIAHSSFFYQTTLLEDILGTQDDRKSTSRLWMNRLEFSKVIGKGGQTISNIRTTCGAQVKGTDIDAENRLVVVTGTLRQVLEAFEMITDLMHAAYCQTVPSEHFSVQMLLEHSKVTSLFNKNRKKTDD